VEQVVGVDEVVVLSSLSSRLTQLTVPVKALSPTG
jgi:hypothetical protein